MKRIEIGNAVDAEDDSLAIDDELLSPILQRGLDDPGIALCLVIAAAGDQAHPVSIALDAEAGTIMFDSV
jgi:hypothetical protein